MEGRSAGNVNVPILFFNNSNEFQAFMQELKSQGLIMTVILEEMKQQTQSNLENLREREQKRQFSNELGGQHFENLRGAGEFHCSPM